MSPSWYDVLDVDPDATAEQIRAAWKAAIADLDPTDRRFRIRNQAAEVLLDPARRAAYDAELAAAPDEVGPEITPEITPELDEGADEEVPPGLDAETRPGTPAPRDAPEEDAPEEAAPYGDAPFASSSYAGRAEGSPSTPTRQVPTALLAVLAGLVALLTAGCVVLLVLGSPEESGDVEDATVEAQAAAEQAVEVILAYDYRTLDDDAAAAASFLTPEFRDEYDQLFAVIEENAPGIQTVVTSEVIASSIERAGTDRASFLLFVNRPTSNTDGSYISRDQVTVTMENVDGEWLVDDFTTSPPAA